MRMDHQRQMDQTQLELQKTASLIQTLSQQNHQYESQYKNFQTLRDQLKSTSFKAPMMHQSLSQPLPQSQPSPLEQ
jgi:hypothetical protein